MVALDLAEIADRNAGGVAQLLQGHVQLPAAGADQRADLGLCDWSRPARLPTTRRSHSTKIFLI